ncbi:MAG: VWA domain-containing protein, partial [Candidatus Aenigmatarchaeota archaeon]
VKKELQEQIDKAIKEAAKKFNKEIEEKQKQIEAAKQRQEELDKEIKDLEEKAKGASGKEKEELEKQIQEKKAEKLSQEMKQKQAEEELKQIQETLEQIESGQEMPYPEDKLSEETKRELEKLFKNLPSKKQKELKEKAQKTLEDFEDAVNKEMEGKLNEDRPESHRERREREKAKREAATKSQEEKKWREEMRKELERIRREKMSEYEKIREEVAFLIDDLYYRLRKILMPEEYGEEETGWPSGKEIDMARAMQAQKDILQKMKMWIRETVPEERDYRFLHLIDLSYSMRGKKILETLKGLIVVIEAVDRIENLNSENLTIHQEITAFADNVLEQPLKSFKERFSNKTEDNLAKLPELVGGGTNTLAGIIRALEDLKKNLGKTGNFLLVFSDGEPNYDIREELKKVLKNKDERKGIKVGLIWLGESDSEKTLQKLVEEYGFDFGIVMPAITPKDPKKRNFAQKLADLLEDIVKNPEKY